MLKTKYKDFLQKKSREFFPNENVKIFIFGSSLEKEKFNDIDLGIMGDFEEKLIYELRDALEQSNLPYLVDVVNFNQVSEDFKNFVLNQKLVWL